PDPSVRAAGIPGDRPRTPPSRRVMVGHLPGILQLIRTWRKWGLWYDRGCELAAYHGPSTNHRPRPGALPGLPGPAGPTGGLARLARQGRPLGGGPADALGSPPGPERATGTAPDRGGAGGLAAVDPEP